MDLGQDMGALCSNYYFSVCRCIWDDFGTDIR